MTDLRKTTIINKLKDKLEKAKSLVFVDYSGLSVPQQQKLRNKVKEVGGEFTIAKNTLFKLALQNAKFKMKNLELKGPTAMLFAYQDELAPIKPLVEFIEEFELPQIKIGFIEGQLMEKEAILELAKIPGKQELLAKLTYLLNSPISGLANVLSGNMRKLIFIIANIKKGGEN